MRTYFREDEEMTCLCNYSTEPLVFWDDKLIVECSICRHTEAFPEYALNFPVDGILDYYVNPIRTDMTHERGLIEQFKNSFWATIRKEDK